MEDKDCSRIVNGRSSITYSYGNRATKSTVSNISTIKICYVEEDKTFSSKILRALNLKNLNSSLENTQVLTNSYENEYDIDKIEENKIFRIKKILQKIMMKIKGY